MLKRRIIFLLIFWVNTSVIGYSQEFKHLFDAITQPAPDVLDISVLKAYPKFRNIHHDTFYRRKTNRDVLQPYMCFKTNKVHYKVIWDVADSRSLTNSTNWRNKQRIIEVIDTKRENYGIQIKRGDCAIIALRVVDASNLYYVSFEDKGITVKLVDKGKCKKIFALKSIGNENAYVYLQDNVLYIYEGFVYRGQCYLDHFVDVTRCGFMMRGKKGYCIDEFCVNYLDKYYDSKIDSFIEKEEIKGIGNIQSEKGLVSISRKHSNKSNASLRFQLDYYSNWEKHKIASGRRTEIVPKIIGAKPLDSWISSFDIYFPGKNDGEEYYAKDKLMEVIWQSHDNGAAQGLSPHVVLRTQNDIIRFETLWRESLEDDKSNVSASYKNGCPSNIAILVDTLMDNKELMQIEKGKWHNFTIYIKEGYTVSQLPRSIVYIDGKKVIDLFVPNAYNCEERAEYLKMGIYKATWKSGKIDSNVRKRVLYYDNIIYLR